MHLYYFDIHDGGDWIDPTGKYLAGPPEARIEAGKRLSEALETKAVHIWKGDDMRIEVLDEQRVLLFQLFAFASVSAAGRKAKF